MCLHTHTHMITRAHRFDYAVINEVQCTRLKAEKGAVGATKKPNVSTIKEEKWQKSIPTPTPTPKPKTLKWATYLLVFFYSSGFPLTFLSPFFHHHSPVLSRLYIFHSSQVIEEYGSLKANSKKLDAHKQKVKLRLLCFKLNLTKSLLLWPSIDICDTS